MSLGSYWDEHLTMCGFKKSLREILHCAPDEKKTVTRVNE